MNASDSSRPAYYMCRLCMSTNSTLHDIFTINSLDEEASIATQVIWLTQLQISVGDGLPTKACSRCIVQLNAALDFINQCIYSDKSFRGIHSSTPAVCTIVPKAETITDDSFAVANTSARVKEETLDDLDNDEEESFHTNENESFNTSHEESFTTNHEESCTMKEEEPFNAYEGEVFDNSRNYHHQALMCTTVLGDGASEIQTSESSTSKPRTKAELKFDKPTPANWFECEFCGRSFEKKMSLASHLKKHTRTTKLKSYGCEECGLTFLNKVEQAVHAVRHTGIKPFPCHFCDDAFTRIDSLRKHIRIHTKEKPFKCSMCENAYSQKWTLRLHERRHIGFAPHKCAHCARAFCDPSNLRSHVTRIHGEGRTGRTYGPRKAKTVKSV